MIALGEVETSYVHTRVNHFNDSVGVVATRTKCRDNLGAAFRHVDCFENAGEFDAGGGFLAAHYFGAVSYTHLTLPTNREV